MLTFAQCRRFFPSVACSHSRYLSNKGQSTYHQYFRLPILPIQSDDQCTILGIPHAEYIMWNHLFQPCLIWIFLG